MGLMNPKPAAVKCCKCPLWGLLREGWDKAFAKSWLLNWAAVIQEKKMHMRVLAFPLYLLSKIYLDCLKKQTLKNADGCKLIFLKGSKPFATWLEFSFNVYPKTLFSCCRASWPAGSTPQVWQAVLPSHCLKSPRKLSSKRQWLLAVAFFAFHGLHFSFLLRASCLRINSHLFLSVRHLLPWFIKALYIFCVDLVNNFQMQLWSCTFTWNLLKWS